MIPITLLPRMREAILSGKYRLGYAQVVDIQSNEWYYMNTTKDDEITILLITGQSATDSDVSVIMFHEDGTCVTWMKYPLFIVHRNLSDLVAKEDGIGIHLTPCDVILTNLINHYSDS